jgi:nucleoside transporter
MNSAIRSKLSVMMFLEYVIWGAWLPLLGLYLTDYLKFDGLQRAWIFNAFAIASLTGMFFGGQLADRYFAQEKFLAISHLLGGLAMFALVYQRSFWGFFGLMLLHCFFYVPTLSITNAISFASLNDPQKEFGYVRLWGTIGWIAASLPFVFIPIDWAKVPSMEQAGGFVSWLGTALSKSSLKTGSAMEAALTGTFVVSGIASLALAAFCLLLPHTPPAKKEGGGFAPLEAMRLLAIPAVMALFVVTLLDSLVHYCYFFWTSTFLAKIGLAENWIAPSMTIGQFCEIPAMALLGVFLKRLGWRTTMIIGILGQAVRFGIYSIGRPELVWLVIGSNLVHGFAYACFFATVYIFVDENFPKDVRNSAQGLFNVLILGFGPFFGNFLWGWLGDYYSSPRVVDGKPVLVDGKPEMVVDFGNLFLVPMIVAIVAAVILALFFHPAKKVGTQKEEPLLAV